MAGLPAPSKSNIASDATFFPEIPWADQKKLDKRNCRSVE